MAVGQGICTNCGSLIMLEDREELCECLFCNCVFPSADALALAKDSEGHVFPNEPQEKQEGTRKLTVTPVFQDPVPAAVAREEKKKAIVKEAVVEYEISPDDVKPPKKTVQIIVLCTIVFFAIVAVITIPRYLTRNNHRTEITNEIATVFTEFKVDTEKDEKGYYVGFLINGQKNTDISVVTQDKIDETAALATFKNYASLRAKAYEIDESDFSSMYAPLSMRIYSSSGVYSIQVNSADDLQPENVVKLN